MSTAELIRAKKELRKRMRCLRDALDTSWKAQYDNKISTKLIEISQQTNAKVIHTYLPIGSEINIEPAI